MGFYGDAIYYLPNGIAADVLDGIITPIKLDREYQEYIHLGIIENLEKEQLLFQILNYDTEKGQLSFTDAQNRKITIKNSTELRSKNLRFVISANYNTYGNAAKLPIGAYYSIGFLDRHWLLFNSTNTMIYLYNSKSQKSTPFTSRVKYYQINNMEQLKNSVKPISSSLEPTFSVCNIVDNPTAMRGLPSGPCIVFCIGDFFYFYYINGSQYKWANGWTGAERQRITADDIAFDTITGGDAEGKGNIGSATIKQYNMGDNSVNSTQVVSNSIYGNARGAKHHIAEGSIGTDDIANYAIKRDKIGEEAVSYEEIAPESIVGRAKSDDEVLKHYAQHIVKESLAGGENGDIAENTITNYNIASGTIERDRLANDYLEYIYYDPDDGITFDSLRAYLRNGEATGPKKNNILISFQLTQDIDYLSKGNYFAIPCPLDGSYDGGQVFWHLTNLNTKQEWIWNVHRDIQELKNTDINIAEDAIKEYHIENGQIHGSGDNLDHPNYQHIAEKSIGTNDIADGAIKRNQINDWAVQKEHVAGHAIQGLASDDVFILSDGTKKSHIAPESIAGGENGDIAENTITNYNIAPGTIENSRLAEKYYSHIDATETIVNLETLITKLTTLRSDQKFYFSIANSGDLYSYYKLSLSVTYCAEKKLNWIIYPCNTNSNLILNYYIISDLDKTLTPAGIKIGENYIENYSIQGSANGEIPHIKEGSIDTMDIANGAITQEKIEQSSWNKLKEQYDIYTEPTAGVNTQNPNDPLDTNETALVNGAKFVFSNQAHLTLMSAYDFTDECIIYLMPQPANTNIFNRTTKHIIWCPDGPYPTQVIQANGGNMQIKEKAYLKLHFSNISDTHIWCNVSGCSGVLDNITDVESVANEELESYETTD